MKTSSTFWKFQTIRTLIPGAKSIVFQLYCPPQVEKFRLKPRWMKSCRYIWRDKKFENGDLSRLLAFFLLERSTSSLVQKMETMMFHRKTVLQVKCLQLRPRWRIDFCIFGEKWVATSRKLNTNCVSSQSLSLRIAERYFPADSFSKYLRFFYCRKTRRTNETDTGKLK